MAKNFILAFDQGTTSSRSILFDHEGAIRASVSKEFEQIYPQPGWVEHDPNAIWETQLATAQQVLAESGVGPDEIAAIGIANQRETTVVWDRATGEPIHNAIVWQCRRTADYCDELAAQGLDEEFKNRTGLVIDAYFSGTKLKWLLDTVPGARERAAKGELCFGTVDAWLLYKLTGVHATDCSNASRTLLYNIHDHQWDPVLLEHLSIPPEILPEVKPTSGVFGTTTLLGGEIPVAALVGDQQGALFGQAAFASGDSKNTYGTGCFLLMNTGETPVASTNGLITTIAWDIDDTVEYALEGSVFIAGAVIQWLRDELRIIDSAAESEEIAAQVPDSAGVYVVPAFVGLGAPYWDMHARGIITGLTRGAGRPHIVRAALESIAYQSADLLQGMEADTSKSLPSLKVDGGASLNNLLMQHQADVLGVPVIRGKIVETTALGAVFFAGLAVSFWNSKEELKTIWKEDRTFNPQWDKELRDKIMAEWHDAVEKARTRN